MSHEDTLVKVITIPSINPNSKPFNMEKYHNTKGIIIKDWCAWSDHTECKLQYLDILIEGEIVRYWRASFDNSERLSLEDPGFWEIAGHRHQAYEIKPIQLFLSG